MTTDTTTPAPVSDMTAGQFLYSLNGFDEIAIAARFGMRLADLRKEGEAVTLARALAFVDMRRNGEKDAAAYEGAMELTIEQVTHYFTAPPTPPKKKKGKKKKAADVSTSPGDDALDGGAEGKS